MSTTQTWRVVLASGAVREVVLRGVPGLWSVRGERVVRYVDPADCVAEHMRSQHVVCVEILAPGEMTRAEAVAAARRGGAEAMRAAGIAACVRVRAESDNKALGRDRDAACFGARRCRDAIRALPLPGDEAPKGAPAPAATRATDALNALAGQARDLVRARTMDDDDRTANLVLWRDLNDEGAPWQAGVIEESGLGDVPILCGNSAADPEQAVASFRENLLIELAAHSDEAAS